MLRQETTLHRQIDQTVRLLCCDVTQLFAQRARALAELDATEADCKLAPELAADVERLVRADTHSTSLSPDFDLTRLDNTTRICENKPAPVTLDPNPPAPAIASAAGERGPQRSGEGGPKEVDPNSPSTQVCENEPLPPPEPKDRDVSYVHPDGHPAYLQPDTWRTLQQMRDGGEHAHAEEHDTHYRRLHLFYQSGDLTLLQDAPKAAESSENPRPPAGESGPARRAG